MKVFNVYKTDRYWNAVDESRQRGIVRGPVKETVLEKATERAGKEKCSKVVVYKEDGSKETEKLVGRECAE